MSDFPYALGSASTGSVPEAIGPSGGPRELENPVSSLAELLQSHGDLPGSPLAEVVEARMDLSVVEKHEEESTRSVGQMEREGVFLDTDGDGIPDYRDVSGSESRFEQEADKGTAAAMEMLRAMMGGVLGFSFRTDALKSEEGVNEISKAQGGALQTTLAATHKNRVTTELDVGVSPRHQTAQRRREFFRRTRELKGLGHMESFYKNMPKVENRSRIGDDMSKPR
ncbi:MAG: hypothetical protein LBD54_03075 [Puniceicoccales bacterium]|jgi:hypothetical protein|nr:hypothetical protein [Puniceicoccales bacterium]